MRSKVISKDFSIDEETIVLFTSGDFRLDKGKLDKLDEAYKFVPRLKELYAINNFCYNKAYIVPKNEDMDFGDGFSIAVTLQGSMFSNFNASAIKKALDSLIKVSFLYNLERLVFYKSNLSLVGDYDTIKGLIEESFKYYAISIVFCEEEAL